MDVIADSRFLPEKTVLVSRKPDWRIVSTSAMLAVPVSLGVFKGFEFNPAFALAPFIAFIYFKSLRAPLNLTFGAAAIGGILSIAIAHFIKPANLPGSIEGLLFGSLFAPSFIFLGRELSERVGLKPLVMWLAFWSTIFLIAITAPLLIEGEQVRGIDGDGHSFMNVRLFGLPVYASYGVNSLAPLIAIQTAIICGAFLTANWFYRLLFGFGIACGVFLLIGAESRGAQLGGLLIVPALMWFGLHRTSRRYRMVAITLTIILLSAAVAFVLESGQSRLASSVSHVSKSAASYVLGAPTEKTPDTKNYEGVSTGRILLWKSALLEWQEHPLIGTGFSGFGRYTSEPLPRPLMENSTAHMYYLNVLWKGGVLFAGPLFAMLIIAIFQAFKNREYPYSSTRYFSVTAVIVAFTLPSFFWDTLMIPSAGAFAWLLLGALGARQHQKTMHARH